MKHNPEEETGGAKVGNGQVSMTKPLNITAGWLFSKRGGFVLRGHVVMPGDTCDCHDLEQQVLLASTRWGPGTLLNTLQCTE